MDKTLILALAATPAAFLAGDLYAASLMTYGQPVVHLADAAAELPSYLASGGAASAEPMALMAGLLLACAIWLAYARHLMNAGEHRSGEEHGSARWATKKEMGMFADDEKDNNIILTRNCRMALVPERFDLKTDRNKNVLVIGGSGSGKTRYFVKPNLMQLNSSFFVTDPKGTLIADTGAMFERAGYEIRQFNTIDFSASNGYNPLAYVGTESDILTFVECLIKNTTGEEGHGNDPFWENAERLLYTALTAYLLDHCPPENRNIPGLLTLLSLAEAREEDESFKSPLDLLFDELETGWRPIAANGGGGYEPQSRRFDEASGSCRWIRTGDPIAPDDDFALSNYRAFKVAAGPALTKPEGFPSDAIIGTSLTTA